MVQALGCAFILDLIRRRPEIGTHMTLVEHSRDSAPVNPTPAYARPRLILYVFLGGAIGAGARIALEIALPWSSTGVPWAVVIANLGGAFILGFLLTALSRRDPETPAKRDVRLFVGTGMMGGFTTYSSFATDTAVLLTVEPVFAVIFGILGVLTGVLAAALGVWIAAVTVRKADAPEERTA